MEKFLREHVKEVIDFKKKNMKFLTKEQQKSYENTKLCYTFKEEIKYKHAKDK